MEAVYTLDKESLPRLEQVETYLRLLAHEGMQWGLLGPRETDKLWERHILNSLSILPMIDRGKIVVDLGSGAGLPGIPLALYRKDLLVTLVEPKERRVKFLELCLKEITAVEDYEPGDLPFDQRVRIIKSRAEDYQPPVPPDVVTCRALAPVSKLVTIAGPLLDHAPLLAIKGDKAAQEVEDAREVLSARHLEAQIITVVSHSTRENATVNANAVGTVVTIRKAITD
ncbi:MAG: 16S rRNA (guanine(527)-N(7))-methyltransferase RsmG [Propionibacteriaceae bacterium]|nr:16S rRNA (guanine(527)-N(7))-methyltransferase RsmG [Propionibacteriaceae bacterium]